MANTLSSDHDVIHVALIYGSAREGRFCDTVARWARSEIERRGGFAIDPIDPLELGLPVRREREESGAVRSLRERIARADAFVIVTPEYNHGYTAELKFLIDLVGEEWRAKPVGFVSYGGVSGGLRAVEQLRLVFAELQAVTVKNGVSFAGVWEKFGGDGELLQPERPRRSLGLMLGQLSWWAKALRHARRNLPFAPSVAA